MKRSANEISALVSKAARGAGLPLAVTEDLARVAPGMGAEALDAVVQCISSTSRHADLCEACLMVEFDENGGGDELCALLRSPHAGDPPYDVPADIWSELERLARMTFVPESEASRRAGAGAGEIDND
ncbi:hypothetical protein ACXYMO_10400 [Arenibacterium sp. CAU 1754]